MEKTGCKVMEKSGCKTICGAPATLAVKGLMMMMMIALDLRTSTSLRFSSLGYATDPGTQTDIQHALH